MKKRGNKVHPSDGPTFKASHPPLELPDDETSDRPTSKVSYPPLDLSDDETSSSTMKSSMNDPPGPTGSKMTSTVHS